jgi:hypothetical protein
MFPDRVDPDLSSAPWPAILDFHLETRGHIMVTCFHVQPVLNCDEF